MMRKFSTAGLMALALHAAAFATAIADTRVIPDSGMIEILSKEESGVPGYYHMKYVFWHQKCQDNMPVDYYGPALDPNDSEVLKRELKTCSEQPDGESDGGSAD